MKKEVYFFDKMYFNENHSLCTATLKPLNELSRHYSSLGLSKPFTKEIMLQAVTNIPELKKSIVSDLAESMNLGSVPKVVSESLQTQIETSLQTLVELAAKVKQQINIARQFTRSSLIEDYTLFEVTESGEVVFNEASEQRLKDMCSIYLTNEVQKKAVSMVSEINAKTKELRSILSNQMTTVPESNKAFFNNFMESFNGSEFSLNPWVVQRLR